MSKDKFVHCEFDGDELRLHYINFPDNECLVAEKGLKVFLGMHGIKLKIISREMEEDELDAELRYDQDLEKKEEVEGGIQKEEEPEEKLQY